MLPGLLPIHNVPSGPVIAAFTADGGLVGSGSATATHSGASFGVASGNRIVLAAISWGAIGGTLLSATIGGVAATIIGQADTGGSGFHNAWIAASPAGASGNIVYTFSNTVVDVVSEVWSIIDGLGIFTFQSSATTSITGVIRVALGAIFGIIRHGTDANSIAWTNVATEDADAMVGGSGGRYGSAHETTATGSTVTVTAAATAGLMSVVTVH